MDYSAESGRKNATEANDHITRFVLLMKARGEAGNTNIFLSGKENLSIILICSCPPPLKDLLQQQRYRPQR